MEWNTVALAATGALGTMGWLFAWIAERSVVAKDREVATAKAGEVAAKALTLAADAKASVAEAKLASEVSRALDLQVQLDAERKARHDLVDELAKKGVPVGDSLVDAAMDRLYQDGGGQDPGSGSSGDPQRVSGQPPTPAGSSGQGGRG